MTIINILRIDIAYIKGWRACNRKGGASGGTGVKKGCSRKIYQISYIVHITEVLYSLNDSIHDSNIGKQPEATKTDCESI